MNNQDNKKLDGYITIGKSLTESMDIQINK